MISSMLNFNVEVSAPELIGPEKPTQQEFKYLSNIDDQTGLRNHIPFVHFFPPSTLLHNHDPVLMIKQALAKVLVFYYPVAGRLRNADNGKLVVDCCDEGVIFRGGYADIKVSELCGAAVDGELRPPFPQWDNLSVDDIWGSNFITDSPLLRMQVTRLSCGGVVLAYTFNHCICDAYGAYQFIKAISEFCTNPSQTAPSLLPTWERQTLKPRSPPTISYETSNNIPTVSYSESHFKSLAQTSVFLSRINILARKTQFKNNQKCPTFDAVSACLWRARTRTLMSQSESSSNTTTRLLFPIDTRFRYEPLLPKGYYGSAVVFPCAITEVSKLVHEPLTYAASLISEVKDKVADNEYRASVLDFIEVNGRKVFFSEGAFVVSDMTRLRFVDLDFGWRSKAIYGGPARAGTGLVPEMVTSLISHKSKAGLEGMLALVSLPSECVDKFHKEVRKEIGCVSLAKTLSAL